MATKSKSKATSSKKSAPKKLKDLKAKKNPKGGPSAVVSLGKLGRVE